MQSIKSVLRTFDPFEAKYISREYQAFGVHLAEKLGDTGHKSLYIKFAKTMPRAVLEEALRFVSDSNAKNKAALFMWKLKELGVFKKSEKSNVKSAKLKSKK